MEYSVRDGLDEADLSTSSSTSSLNSNLSARPKGLSNEDALSRLVRDIRRTLESKAGSSFKTILSKSLDPSNETSLFPISAIVVGILQATFLFAEFAILSTFSQVKDRQPREINYEDNEDPDILDTPEIDSTGDSLWFALQAFLILFLVVGNILFNFFEQFSSDREMRCRIEYITKRLDQVKSDAGTWLPTNYPHLHTPLSSSVVLQWTLRNGSLVNLPWALLVEGDVILIKPGQVAPGRCHSLEEPFVHIDSSQVLHVRSEDSGYDLDPKPRFCRPLTPQLFILDETPYLKIVSLALNRGQLIRPASVLWKYSHLFFTRILCHWLCPLVCIIVVGWNLVCYIQEFTFYNRSDISTLILVHPVAVSLPLLSLTFPLCWMLANYFALAKLVCMFGSFRHVKITDDPFDDNVGNSDVETPARDVSCAKLKSYFVSAFLGTGEFLSRTENIVHTLGSITALCCTDKKGVLSWPNTSAEKIFLLKKKEDEVLGRQTDRVSSEQSNESEKPVSETPPHSTQIVAEILTVTHDHTNPFNVEFDDPNWKQHLSHLKPLGLSILLNTCNIRTEEQYTNFYNHLTCESMKVGEQVSERRRHHEKSVSLDVTQEQADELASCVDVLPIVTRGCLCDLSRKIGLGAETTASKFKLTNQIQTFRHVQTDLHDKFARHLSLANLKFPFPHMVSVMVDEAKTRAGHLISQGTADILLDACADLWTGSDLEPLTDDVKKKILDFYHRSCLSAYCTAFAYRPLTFTFPKDHCLKEYLQLPTHNLKFYSQHSSEDTNVLNADILGGGDIAHWKLKQRDKVQTASDCLELECNQSFLGMVQLEYQARVDMVQLIDLLEKACIRFVHFSKENELRSRVFSEKMGLESGWNCHISLRNRSDKHGNRPSVTSVRKMKRKKSLVKKARRGRGLQCKVGASIPVDLERQKGIFDYLKWHEINRKDTIAVFKSKLNFEQDNSNSRHSPFMDYTPGYCRDRSLSRDASAVSDSDPFEYDMSNRAQLPEGIENIRPHLETMDNVPLLVSLFTDCTPETTTEMVVIMQEYGEVVCVMGSAAQFQNVPVFLQADASLAIEPLYPQLCQTIPVFVPPSPSHGSRSDSPNVSLSPTWPSPVAVSQLLNSLASSLSFRVEDEISLFHLILESRHSTRALLNALQFWVGSLIAVSFLQLVAILVTLPLFLTIGQTLWLTLVVIPLLSMSLVGNNVDPEIMNVSTGKNIFSDITSKEVILHVLWCYGLRFLPAISLLSLAHLLAVVDTSCSNSILSSHSNETLLDCSQINNLHTQEDFVQNNFLQSSQSNTHFNVIWTEVYVIVVAFSFLFRSHQLWQKNPFKKNCCFMLTVLFLLVIQFFYTCLIGWLGSDLSELPPLHVWLIWALGLPSILILNELIKRQEIKVEVRYQKRQRLEFQTKLGINSPF